MATTVTGPHHADLAHRAELTRKVAAALAAGMAALYLLIFTGVLSVGEATGGELGILGVAGAVYAGLAALLLVVRKRALWIVAALVQLPIFWAYLAISVDRDPPYERWGVTIRVLQAGLFVALARLALRRPKRDVAATAGGSA